jgi:hypothetical protein
MVITCSLGSISTVTLNAWKIYVQHKETMASPNGSVEYGVLATCETQFVYLALTRHCDSAMCLRLSPQMAVHCITKSECEVFSF